MCTNVEVLKMSPNAPIFAYPGTKPVNQSLVTQIDGINLRLQQYSKQALLKTAIYLVVIAASASGYGIGNISD
jgi:hypothetical protein